MMKSIHFIKIRHYAYALSGTLILLSILGLLINGLNYGIDFTGGTSVILKFIDPVSISDLSNIRKVMEKNGLGSDVHTQSVSDKVEAKEIVVGVKGNKLGTQMADKFLKVFRQKKDIRLEDLKKMFPELSIKALDRILNEAKQKNEKESSIRITFEVISNEEVGTRISRLIEKDVLKQNVPDGKFDLNRIVGAEQLAGILADFQAKASLPQLINKASILTKPEELTALLGLEKLPLSWVTKTTTFSKTPTPGLVNIPTASPEELKKFLHNGFVYSFEKDAHLIISYKVEEADGLLRKLKPLLTQVTANTKKILIEHAFLGHFLVLKNETIGASVGKDLREKALLSVLLATLLMLLYIAFRFEIRFGVTAILALIHDTLITLGLFAWFGTGLHLGLFRVSSKEFTIQVLAAILTIIGYSINDTIVTFDRIRENMGKTKRENFIDMVNRSIHEMLSRTMMTSLTTFGAVFAIFLFGGAALNGLSFALLIGVIVGTYSSIFVAAPLLIEYDHFAIAFKNGDLINKTKMFLLPQKWRLNQQNKDVSPPSKAPEKKSNDMTTPEKSTPLKSKPADEAKSSDPKSSDSKKKKAKKTKKRRR